MASERLLWLEAAYTMILLCLFLPLFVYIVWRIFQPISHCTECVTSLASTCERDSVKVESIICNLIYIDVAQRSAVNPQGRLAARGLRSLHNYRRYPVSESIFKYKSSGWEDFNSCAAIFNSASFPFPALVPLQTGTEFPKILSERTGCCPLLTRYMHASCNAGTLNW